MKSEDPKYWHCDFGNLELRVSGDTDEIDVWRMLLDVDGTISGIQEWDFLSEGEMVEFFAGMELDECLFEGDVWLTDYEFHYGDEQGYRCTRPVAVRIHDYWIE